MDKEIAEFLAYLRHEKNASPHTVAAYGRDLREVAAYLKDREVRWDKAGNVVLRGGWRPHSAVLGRADGVKGYHDITRYPGARLIPGLVLFRWEAPLFFANAELFHNRAPDAVASSPTPVRWLVVAAEPVTSVDVTAPDMLVELDRTLQSAGIELCFAEMKGPVKDKLKRFELFPRLGAERFFPTLGAAVGAYLATHAVDWKDWEDRKP